MTWQISTNALIAALHYFALAVGFWSISERTIMARKISEDQNRRAVLQPMLIRNDNLWGIAAILWLVSGFARAFLGLEKSPDFYLRNGFFHLKMTVFVLVLLVEIKPMITLIRQRLYHRRTQTDLLQDQDFRMIYRHGMIEVHLLMLMVILAAFMARGVWLF